ncbi:glutamine amidotransferase [Zhouia amylolytica]|uniref:Imidazole glycerol phosphate synthase subunit HisH n=2 Tax=Zhouia amylolytica TaxID=376730 RepID=W2UNF8_9FLAO|nr:imidazole glycerol phosphate synthase subunit HisH [Zhouia amylolytica]ETN95538.1 imidazole glycerol phosphate synthase, glutamine amidotransferase subunit [Zhouia amylolytica AD3]MCQ0110731.1 imidazole glycerol phosphate synthase subunit HisH [Zhouia amylolytica]SFT03488.1 glutamine amidotransferase [Zhouia amylolytica]
MKIVIIDYGAGNIQSIIFAFQRLGFKPVLSNDPDEIMTADKVIFPGVGEASSAMRKLKETGLDSLIPRLKQPVLGICLGMQLMCNGSEEGSTKGLGIFNVDVIRFNNSVKVPQIGWNQIKHPEAPFFSEIKNNEYMYLVHSYYAPLCEDTIASATYGVEYSVALQKNNFYGVQFHPEKSSIAGEQLIKNFLSL